MGVVARVPGKSPGLQTEGLVPLGALTRRSEGGVGDGRIAPTVEPQLLAEPPGDVHREEWYRTRFAAGGSRQRRIGIVAVARRLMIALWRYVKTGQVPAERR